MTKKKIGICIGFLIASVILICIMWYRSTILAEVHESVKPAGMIASESGFALGNRKSVKILVKSVVDEGDVLITLQNEKDEILYTFDTDCTQKETLTLDAGRYKLRIDSEKFKGSCDIVVRK